MEIVLDTCALIWWSYLFTKDNVINDFYPLTIW